jgi:KDO2-lipid IV(A) lauroyltransferase
MRSTACSARFSAMAEYRPRLRRLYRRLAYPPQALAAWAVYGVFALLPVDAASAVGGFLGRVIGPLLPVTARARRNLARALPELDTAARAAVIRAMWDNLGRVVGEYPHLERIARDAGKGGRVEITGTEHIAGLREPGRPCIFFSGHLANWEIFALAARATGLPYAQVYRAPNNPFVDSMLRRVRRLEERDIVPKGVSGARKAVAVLREGRRLGMLVDQKLNDGIRVPFFGIAAMTAPAVAQLALRFGCPVIPVRMERLGGCRFRASFHPPLILSASDDRGADIAAAMRAINAQLEDWIRERPGQWLWLHRRWPES